VLETPGTNATRSKEIQMLRNCLWSHGITFLYCF
jgi:hypothetical protein